VLSAGPLAVGSVIEAAWIEAKIPSESFSPLHPLRQKQCDGRGGVRKLLKSHGFTIANMSYRTSDDGSSFEYRMVIKTTDSKRNARLAQALRELDRVRQFRILPTGD
jgi:putative Mg2+ transporter-C (MgtC) family protein